MCKRNDAHSKNYKKKEVFGKKGKFSKYFSKITKD